MFISSTFAILFNVFSEVYLLFSTLLIVSQDKPTLRANSFCVSPFSFRIFLICSPIVILCLYFSCHSLNRTRIVGAKNQSNNHYTKWHYRRGELSQLSPSSFLYENSHVNITNFFDIKNSLIMFLNEVAKVSYKWLGLSVEFPSQNGMLPTYHF